MSKSSLKRAIQPMPDFVSTALRRERLVLAYGNRPSYQQNDYLLWINSAKRQETKDRRLEQMLDELRIGGVYMKMKHPASEKNRKR